MLFQEKPSSHFSLPVPHQDVVVAYLGDRDGSVGRNLRVYFPGIPIHVMPAYPAAEDNIHVARYLCETLALAGLPVDPARAMERAGKRALLEGSRQPMARDRIVIHPGSGSSRKNFSPEFWTAFLNSIMREPALKDHRMVVLLGPAEEGVLDFFENRVSSLAEIVFCPRNEKLVSLLGQAGLYAGHDSGVTHLAAMLGTPTIALFRENNVSRWQPLGPCTRVIRSQKAGKACRERMVQATRSLLPRGETGLPDPFPL